MERTIERLWILAIILVVLLVGSNAAWMYYENQFEDTVITQDVKQDSGEGGMSNGYSRMMPYMDDMSYARRDSMGRYSRDNFRDSSYRGQSYENNRGYSRDNTRQKMVNKLETLMDDTMSEHERNAIMDCIEKIK